MRFPAIKSCGFSFLPYSAYGGLKLIDIVVREFAGFRIDCKRNKRARKVGINTFKFNILEYNLYDKNNPILNRYIHTDKADVEDMVGGLPCEEIEDWYHDVRIQKAEEVKSQGFKSRNDDGDDAGDTDVTPGEKLDMLRNDISDAWKEKGRGRGNKKDKITAYSKVNPPNENNFDDWCVHVALALGSNKKYVKETLEGRKK